MLQVVYVPCRFGRCCVKTLHRFPVRVGGVRLLACPGHLVFEFFAASPQVISAIADDVVEAATNFTLWERAVEEVQAFVTVTVYHCTRTGMGTGNMVTDTGHGHW